MRDFSFNLYRCPKGNALFLILIAVALFAALSYAVTQSGRGSGTVNREQSALYAAQITQIGSTVRLAAQRMVLGGTALSSIVAGNPTGSNYPGLGTLNGNANFCTTGSNCLFAPEGGGISAPVAPKAAFLSARPAPMSWGASYFQGAGSFNGILIDGFTTPGAQNIFTGHGTAAADVNLQIYPLTRDVCLAIDKGLGINAIPVYNGSNTINVMNGIDAACVDFDGTGALFIYFQLLADL